LEPELDPDMVSDIASGPGLQPPSAWELSSGPGEAATQAARAPADRDPIKNDVPPIRTEFQPGKANAVNGSPQIHYFSNVGSGGDPPRQPPHGGQESTPSCEEYGRHLRRHF
jgi:hypothetical protein